jgi:hypothetical protein
VVEEVLVEAEELVEEVLVVVEEVEVKEVEVL